MQERTQKTSSDPSVMHLLHRGGQCADDMFSLSVGSSNISPRQFAVLSAVSKRDGISQMDIVSATGIDRSTTAELVKRLVKKGWLQRRRTKEDARAYAVRLTAAGRKALKLGERAALGIDDKVLAALSSRQHAQFIEALGRIVQEFSAENSPS